MKVTTQTPANTTQSAAAASQTAQAAPLADQRPASAALTQLQAMAEGSPRTAAQGQRAEALSRSPRVAAQRQVMAQTRGPALQQKANPASATNRTGLPGPMKAGVESLSGVALDDVRVHYNSADPAQLNALAYTQGSDIHVAPGQEQYLAHEAWHVVQQKQGRVRPTRQLKAGVPLNDDAGLEREADAMGRAALSLSNAPQEGRAGKGLAGSSGPAPVQRVKMFVGNLVVHINDYHFIDRMHLATLHGGNEAEHAVILEAFSDFEGLAAEAEKHREGRNNFPFGGYNWGWNGGEELFPVPNNKDCVNIPGHAIQELITGARNGEPIKNIVGEIKANKQTVVSKYNQAQKKGFPAGGWHLPFTFKRGAVPGILKFSEGSHYTNTLEKGADNAEFFLWGPRGSRDGSHVHCFFSSPPFKGSEASEREITVKSLLFTVRKGGEFHFKGTAEGRINTEGHTLTTDQSSMVEELHATLEIMQRASGPAPKGTQSGKQEEKTQGLTMEEAMTYLQGEGIKIHESELENCLIADLKSISDFSDTEKFKTWLEDFGLI